MNAIKENLYKTIKALKGPKHPHLNYEALNHCADQLIQALKACGLTVQEQVFFVHGDSRPYRNIFAYWGELSKDMTLIGAHYDTVPNTPAANDNLSAVAVILELAKLFSIQTDKPKICFAYFTLEEGHPGYYESLHHRLIGNQILDARLEFTSASLLETAEALRVYIAKQKTGTKYTDCIDAFMALGSYGAKETLYLETLKAVHQDFLAVSPVGKANYTVGSHEFVETMHTLIGRAMILDCVGWVGDHYKVNAPLPLQGLESFLTTHKAQPDQEIGNYLAFMGNFSAKDWLSELHCHCATDGTDFPHISLSLPMPYDVIREHAPDTLRSDHAPFWRKGIPAIFISDTANFRSSRYHTPSDTLEGINYSFLTRLVHALYLFIKA